jgi:hypothetical protein
MFRKLTTQIAQSRDGTRFRPQATEAIFTLRDMPVYGQQFRRSQSPAPVPEKLIFRKMFGLVHRR